MESTLDKLNEIAKKVYSKPLSGHAIEVFPWGDETSTTVCFDKMHDTFMLNDIKAVRIKDYIAPGKYKVPVDYRGVVGIHRAGISIGAVDRILKSETPEVTMQQVFSTIINEGVKDLINQFGMLTPFYKVTLEMPGFEGKFFREMENVAGYELRIVVIKEK